MERTSSSTRYTLIVIDMLLDFFERSRSLEAQRGSLVARLNELSRAFREHRQPVIWIRQEFRPDLRDAFLEMRRRHIPVTIAGTKGAEILPELERLPSDVVVIKKRYSAFFRTELEDVLGTFAPWSLVFAGINSHACVRTTVIDAYQRDYDVIVAADCVGSYDREHDAVTKKYLDGKIARFLANDQIVSLLSAPASTTG